MMVFRADVVKWYTRYLEVVVPQGVEVQLLSSAPYKKTEHCSVFLYGGYESKNGTYAPQICPARVLSNVSEEHEAMNLCKSIKSARIQATNEYYTQS
jgi:hypothetical protein